MQGGVAAAEPVWSAQRRAMVDGQIRTFDVTDARVIRAFDIVPRERFVPEELRTLAYSDASLLLKPRREGGASRVLIQPMHLARMLQGAAPRPEHRVLVVAGETGYAACLLAELAGHVVSLESDSDLTADATAHGAELGLGKVEAVTGNLAAGWTPMGPYDLIVVQGAIETHLDKLFAQLVPGGRLVAIETSLSIHGRHTGRAMLYQPVGNDVSGRALFDATAPVLPEFRLAPAFVF